MPMIDVIICTYNRAQDLDRCLNNLSKQTADPSRWAVTVIDNNCTDHTADVVARYSNAHTIPRLKRIVETQQGLHHARRRGVNESSMDWLAFVDDDCLLAPDWIEEALDFAEANSTAGGFGGRVIPNWGRSRVPRYLDRHAWLFAHQDFGNTICELENLVGAGAVYNRQALIESGWTMHPYLGDRTAKAHLSGGDVEMSFRVRAGGRLLWFVPTMRLQHIIPESRQRMISVLRIARGLGAGAELLDLMGATDFTKWMHKEEYFLEKEIRVHIHSFTYVVAGRYPLRDWMVRAAFLFGRKNQQHKLRDDPVEGAKLTGIWPHLKKNIAP